MFDLKLLLEFVMNAITDLTSEDVLFVEDKEFLMLIIAKNVFNRKKTEMDVVKLLILEVLERIYFTRERNMDLKNDYIYFIIITIIIIIIISYLFYSYLYYYILFKLLYNYMIIYLF
jgi:hypothetical protein